MLLKLFNFTRVIIVACSKNFHSGEALEIEKFICHLSVYSSVHTYLSVSSLKTRVTRPQRDGIQFNSTHVIFGSPLLSFPFSLKSLVCLIFLFLVACYVTLQPALSVRWSVHPLVCLSVGSSVTLYFFWVFAVFGLTAPAQMIW